MEDTLARGLITGASLAVLGFFGYHIIAAIKQQNETGRRFRVVLKITAAIIIGVIAFDIAGPQGTAVIGGVAAAAWWVLSGKKD